MAKIIIDTEATDSSRLSQNGSYPISRSGGGGSNGEHYYTKTEDHRSSSGRVIENVAARLSQDTGHSVTPAMLWCVGLVAAAWFLFHFLAKFGDGLGTGMGLIGGGLLALIGCAVLFKALRKGGKL